MPSFSTYLYPPILTTANDDLTLLFLLPLPPWSGRILGVSYHVWLIKFWVLPSEYFTNEVTSPAPCFLLIWVHVSVSDVASLKDLLVSEKPSPCGLS